VRECIAAACVSLVVLGCTGGQREAGSRQATSPADLLSGDLSGYALALETRPFAFPADHNSHPEFKTEWWYFTGNLEDGDGRAFGFQLTFFRYALSPQQRAGTSPWRAHQGWMGHLAVTDVAERRFFSAQRLSRAALGLAGNTAAPYALWLEDWSATADAADPFPLRLSAADRDFALDLMLTARKPPVLQGERGLDRKGPEPGNASYYYSVPRLSARGEIAIDDAVHAVQGNAWMDREWSSNALSPELQGWDWFAIQLSDGRDLMFYRLRTASGETSAYSGGTLIEADGSYRALAPEEIRLQATEFWTSPVSGARYPVGWQIEVPQEDLSLAVEALIPNQEMNLAVRYWEGAVAATGSSADGAISGRGYLELTGY